MVELPSPSPSPATKNQGTYSEAGTGSLVTFFAIKGAIHLTSNQIPHRRFIIGRTVCFEWKQEVTSHSARDKGRVIRP